MQAHMARLCADAASLRRPDIEPHIGHATLHLAQALIAGAENTEPRARAILNEALDARIAEYILLHLEEGFVLRSTSGRCARSRHPTEGYPQVLIIPPLSGTCAHAHLGRLITNELGAHMCVCEEESRRQEKSALAC
jgi:hypothetical protein